MVEAKQALLHALALASHPDPRDDLCHALPEPSEGELAILFHQDPARRWWIFEWSQGEPVRLHDTTLVGALPSEPNRVVEHLLGPLRDRLATATHLRLLASGAAHAVVFEALPWDDATLEERFVVTWGLDLPRPPRAVRASEAPLRPVVVSTDPRHEHTPRRALVDALERALGRRFGTDVTTITSDEGSIRDVRALSSDAFLIFLGENSSLAELDVANPRCPAIGHRDPDDPELPPAGLWINQTALDLGTLLTFDPPRMAVLESCATGPVDALGLSGAVGLGHVLAAAGTEQVMVTRTNVCPAEAIRFVTDLVEASAEHPLELPRLLRAIRRTADPDYLHRVLTP